MSTPNDDPTPTDPATPPTPPTPPTPTTDDPAPAKTFKQADIDRAVKKASDDAAKKAKMSEDERRDAELADARGQLRERDTRDAVKEAAAKLGAKNSALVYRAVKEDLTFDKDGKPENLKDVLTQTKKDYPELFTTSGSADGGAGQGGAAPASSLDQQIRQALGKA